jgi:ABC-type lipoprotein release transport system permease subunit
MISISSVFFAAFICLILKSVMEGSTNYIINTTVERQTGTFQAMNSEYWDDRTVNNFIEVDENVLKKWETIPNVKRLTPRIETFAMSWNGTRTKPITLIGIDPARESQFSKLNTRMEEGEFLSQDDKGIIIGSRYAELMHLVVGDTLALIGEGYHGTGAAGLFVVRGIVKTFDPNQDAACAFISINAAQDYIDMPNGATYVSVVLENTGKTEITIAAFKQTTEVNGGNLVYRPWQELIEDLAAGAAADKKTMEVYFYILYLVVGFGLLGTIIMLTNERRKEFGVMAALGMKKGSLIGGLFIEMGFVNLLGLLAGLLLSIPIILYFHYFPIRLTGTVGKSFLDMGFEPVIPFDINVNLFTSQMAVVAVIAVLITLYPYMKIRQLNIIDALRK